MYPQAKFQAIQRSRILKKLALPAAVVFLIMALYIAYTRFESSFKVVGGMSGKAGPPGMPPEAARIMAEDAKKKAAKKAADAKAGNKDSHTSSATDKKVPEEKKEKGEQ